MALTKQDVLDTLADPILARLDFSVPGMHVGAREYVQVRKLIEDDYIQVIEGTNPNNAFYNGEFNTLTTQDVPPPSNRYNRPLLLHECTHAIIDVKKLRINRLSNEVTAYIAQFAYKVMAIPGFVPSDPNPPYETFYKAVVKLVQDFKLDQPAGRGAMLSRGDLDPLRTQLNHLSLYTGVDPDEDSVGDGVPTPLKVPTGPEPVTMKFSSVSYEDYPDPSDGYLIETLQRRYAASDVAGYGARFNELRKTFGKTSAARARELHGRMSTRKAGDRVSMLFHDHLSTEGRKILLDTLKSRF